MSEISRIQWLCRRGMKELDLVLNRYLEHYYESASDVDQAHFKLLLEMPDPELYSLLLGRSELASPEPARFIQFLRSMTRQK